MGREIHKGGERMQINPTKMVDADMTRRRAEDGEQQNVDVSLVK